MNSTSTLPLLPYLPTYPPSPLGEPSSTSKSAGVGDVDDYFDVGMMWTNQRSDNDASHSFSFPEHSSQPSGSSFIYSPATSSKLLFDPTRATSTSNRMSIDTSQFLNFDPGSSNSRNQQSSNSKPPNLSMIHPSTHPIGGTSGHETPRSMISIPSVPPSLSMDGPSTTTSTATIPDLDEYVDLDQHLPSGSGMVGPGNEVEEKDQLERLEEEEGQEGEGEGEVDLDPDNEEPLYVNAKQYHRILKRRMARARLEELNRLSRSRKPYLHESRHRHACNRPRGKGGRFLTADEIEALKKEGAAKGEGGEA